MSINAEDVPIRQHMEDPEIVWRHGSKPDYTDVNEKFIKERTRKHKQGSLERIVEDLVKTWEMESSHKTRKRDWGSVDPDKFYISSNGGRKFNLDDNIEYGNYNMLMDESVLYDASKETNDSSHELFRKTFDNKFPWEVLEVQSGPPTVTFTWRHWGEFVGRYKDVEPTGETLEMYGSCVVRVNESLKIESIEVFYDPNIMLKKLTNTGDKAKCPFHH
ncbi:uncharacterized protein LOC132730494 [Ruditapes philippinarum]|uniref:uncharacterized protein LOC132730494 n=1 Tax=Ruditapes philippinarum TaxID=129788 RepID=UPI00295BA047|nr:uncharacterized protein LOC132730494 [Ruditapes philippinarum]XP_060572429.1 uncharacterized protein LOC132730494 [Ruditapes philippinarum]XP_060572430.1 uncharacterized protein LOC132730494 [Ruditapes philippinarum]XP_060572431.1 uncharacterized protein LOC132730494 [Ruditapes philippinarum]XP_060572432.1 uncharacterized protein LOC132730494 [Ruditapes philippinarum]